MLTIPDAKIKAFILKSNYNPAIYQRKLVSPVRPPRRERKSSANLHAAYRDGKLKEIDDIASSSQMTWQSVAVDVLGLSDSGVSAVLRSLLSLLTDEFNYSISFLNATGVPARLDTGEFAVTKDRLLLCRRLARPPDLLLLPLPDIPSSRLLDRVREPPSFPPQDWISLSKKIFARLPHGQDPRDYRSPKFDSSKFCPWLYRHISLAQSVTVRGSFPNKLSNYIQFMVPDNFDKTDMNPCHCLIVHWAGKTPEEILELLLATGATGAALSCYAYTWLYLFPGDFHPFKLNYEHVADRDFKAVLQFFSQDAVQGYCQFREEGIRTPDSSNWPEFPSDPEKIAEILTHRELRMLQTITITDLIGIGKPSSAIMDYLNRIDRTVAFISLNKDEPDEEKRKRWRTWISVLFECDKNRINFQLGFEIMSAMSQATPPAPDLSNLFESDIAKKIVNMNKLNTLYNPAQEYQALVEQMAAIPDDTFSVPFLPPILLRLRDLAPLAFKREGPIETKFLRLFWDFARIILKNWHLDPQEVEKWIKGTEAPKTS
jgi:hypothetical protein